MSREGEIHLLHFLIQLTLLFVVSRSLADVMKRLGQAPVIGELLGGMILGPSLLGHFAPHLYATLFTADLAAGHILEAFAWTGALMLLFYTGIETDLGILQGMGHTASLVSALGIAIPFASGFGLGFAIPAYHLVSSEQRLIFALFMAVAISISAVPVIAKILIDMGLMRRELGLLILTAGIIDDTTGWILLSVIAGLAEHGAVEARSLITLIATATAFLLFCYFVGQRLVAVGLRWVDDRTFIEHAKFTAMAAIAFVCAIITQAIGIHALFGAFIAGLMVSKSTRIRKAERGDFEAVTIGMLGPVFFAFSGLKANLFALNDPLVLLFVLLVACAAKLVGCGLGGLLGGLRWRESAAVAVGMNARGGMGIIVALIGMSLGILTPGMYTILLLVAVITSMMTPPLLSWSLSRVEERAGDSERTERDRLLARIPFQRHGAKLLVLSGGGPHANLAAHIAASLGNHHDASITVLHASTENSSGNSAFGVRFARIKTIAERCGARNVYQRTVFGTSVAGAILKESERGYDAIFAGASQEGGHDSLGGEILREVLAAARTPVVIARDAGAPMPLRRVLSPVTGAKFSRLGATVAMLYAQAARAQITALYVKEGQRLPLRTFYTTWASRDDDSEVTREIADLGQELGVEVDARVGTARRPENLILSTIAEGEFDLLVMGVVFRSAEQRLYFGPKVTRILREARCAVAVVVPPEETEARS